jgi:hypothetical protein
MKKPSLEKVNAFPELIPGDILLYGDNSLLSWLIRFRTWSDVSHVEVYAGNGRTLAARVHGVREYPLSVLGLRRVIRPVELFHFAAGLQWFEASACKLPYGYADLARFYLLNVPTKGLICSEFVDLFFRHCWLALFNLNYPEGAVCPRDFETLSPYVAEQIWSWE